MNVAIFEQIALYVPLMLGAYLSIAVMKIPNLGIETAYVFGAIIASQILILEGNSNMIVLLLALLMSLCGGAIVGIVVSVFAQYGRFSHILSAIVTMGLFHGIFQWILGGSHLTISNFYNPLRLLDHVKGYPEFLAVALVAIITATLFFMFLRTQLGVCCALYGDNPSFLKSYRINEAYVFTVGMAVSNALAGLTGYMVAQSNGFVDITMGMGLPLLCLSALIIGKSICITSRPYTIWIPLMGIVGYFLLQNWLLMAGFDLRYFVSVQAVIVALFLLISSKITKKSVDQNLLGI